MTHNEESGLVAREVLSRTAHLIKARSAAWGASQCIFRPRLVEYFGSRADFFSTLPTHGNIVHQFLALAFRKYLLENIESIAQHDVPSAVAYVDDAENALSDEGIISEVEPGAILSGKAESSKLMTNAANVLPEICRKAGLEIREARVYSELQVMSYRLHMWGILDSLIENLDQRKAIIIDWKTGQLNEETAARVYDLDIAQVDAYALLEADRLGYHDPRLPVLEGDIVPLIVRSKGRPPVASNSPVFPTLKRKKDLQGYLNDIVLSAEHLTLLVSDVERLVGKAAEGTGEFITRDGRRRSAFRYTPQGLRGYNPKNLKWPCGICQLKEQCLFYIQAGEMDKRTETDILAERSRHAILAVRENALMPYKELDEKLRFLEPTSESIERGDAMRLECGNRLDVFKNVEMGSGVVFLQRELRQKEAEQERIISVREGRPVILYFYEPRLLNPMMAVSFFGRVEDVDYDDSESQVLLSIGTTTLISRIYPLLLKEYLKCWPQLANRIIALEANVDLTQLELSAVDAFQRGTKKMLAKRESEFKDEQLWESKALDVLLGTSSEKWRG